MAPRGPWEKTDRGGAAGSPGPPPSQHKGEAEGGACLRIAIVANEPSGDLLGARLMAALKARHPRVRFEGVGGPRMAAEGLESLVPLERLSVMGLLGVVRRLPELIAIRRRLAARFLADPPDGFIGIDAPDFNLGLEARLRRAGIPCIHYVCPTVWAWRPGRVKTLRRAADLILALFPFEPPLLERAGVRARFVGHPLGQEIPLETDRETAREGLGLPTDAALWVALLPGSRRSEVEALAAPFLEAAAWLHERRPEVRFIVPLVNGELAGLFEARIPPGLPIHCFRGRAREVLGAADLVLTASGTATLEALLVGRPMVVGYRLDPFSYWVVRAFRLVKTPYIAMANLVAGEGLAPEFIQHACNAEALGRALLDLLEAPERRQEILARYREIHRGMALDASAEAADAVLGLIRR